MVDTRWKTVAYLNAAVRETFKGHLGFAGKKNVYVCHCGAAITTLDLEPGVTPFMVKCEACGDMMESNFYRVNQDREHTHEWYRPDNAEYALQKPAVQEHLQQGGLLKRKRKI